MPDFPQPYFLVPVGAATGFNRARKNVPTAVKAFRGMKAGTAKLVIAGTATLTERVLAELLPSTETGSIRGERWLSDDGAITILPTVSRADLLVLMRHAVAVVYPSRYEGFGLPTVEAMAVGTPLIAARATSIPEIVGDAGILIDPDDVYGFGAAMTTLASEATFRTRLVERGESRHAIFSTEQFAEHILKMIRNV